MFKRFFLLPIVVCLLVPSAFCQIPRPYFLGGLNLTRGMGYQPTSAFGGGGFQAEQKYITATFEGFADNAHKIDSGTGRTLRMRSMFFFRPSKNWFVGGGVSYSQLSTDPYGKNAWHPRAGGGYDRISERFSIRLQGEYVLTGSDHLNGLQGPEFNVYLPSPRPGAHWIYRETIGVYRFHPTAGPGNLVGTELRFTAMYRF
jgi:hypothetical protein